MRDGCHCRSSLCLHLLPLEVLGPWLERPSGRDILPPILHELSDTGPLQAAFKTVEGARSAGVSGLGHIRERLRTISASIAVYNIAARPPKCQP